MAAIPDVGYPDFNNLHNPAPRDFTSDFSLDSAGIVEEHPDEYAQVFAAMSPEEMTKAMAEMLMWFIQTDDTSKGLAENNFWLAGNYRARDLLKAYALKRGLAPVPTGEVAPA